MIKITTVGQCPHTVTGQGVMRIEHGIIGMLAGAVEDDIEWLAILTGTRSEDGLDITVTGVEIPEQDRSHAACSLVHNEPLAPNVVGVVHSHHSMGAFFSQTDDTKLNTRFPSSIVIAQLKTNSGDAETMLGFDYKAEGRAILPCGTVGIINFTVLPTPAIEDWPVTALPQFNEPKTDITLRYCPHREETQKGHLNLCTTKCGIEATSVIEGIFGRDSEAFMKDVKKQTRHRGVVTPVHGYPYNPNNRGIEPYHPYMFSREDYIDREGYGRHYNDDFLRHWSCGE